MSGASLRPVADERAKRPKGLGFRPLYGQVRDVLIRRIADGEWQPGAALPSELDIATDLGVSHGTVRKALDAMEADNLVVRRQGRGTYVARHDDARILFQFFRMVQDSGERRFPDSHIVAVAVEAAAPAACERLKLRRGGRVIVIERTRSLANQVCIFERIVLSRARFAGLEKRVLPNNLYELYRADFGVTITRAQERLKAKVASRREARFLGVEPGAPLLAIDRVAFAIDGEPAEWRLSLCRTDRFHYVSDLK
jgi:GntR family transcriptional regulator